MMIKATRTHNREETEETRRKIMEVGRELFMQNGFRAVSTRQVAQACGITQPALYYHFADKQELYVAILLDLLEKIRQELEKLIQNRELPTEERMTAVADYLLQYSKHDLNTMFHDIEHELDPAARTRLNEAFFKAEIQPFQTLLEEAIQAGKLPDLSQKGLSLTAATYLFLGVITSFSQPVNEHHPAYRTEGLARIITNFYLYGLTGK